MDNKTLLEVFLFIAGDPLAIAELKRHSGLKEEEIKGLMAELTEDYRERNGAMLIGEIAGGWQMHTNPEYAEWVRKFTGQDKAAKLSAPSLETLAIVAYRQPMTKAEVEALRGVNSDGVLKTLLERRLVKMVGRKEAPGRPVLYGTTRDFLQHFGLKDLTELPTLKDLEREDV